MSVSTLRILIALVLIGHGLGHALGIFPALGITLSKTHSSASWLLTRLAGETGARAIGVLLWLAGIIAFVGAGLGLLDWLIPYPWWRPLAMGAAIVSLTALVLYWNGLPFLFPNKIGALAVDATLLVCLPYLH